MTEREICQMIDNTMLQPYKGDKEFEEYCKTTMEYGFKMVAINSGMTAYCKSVVKDSGVHVGAAIGFPLGTNTVAVKVFETKDAIDNGADEIDYVLNIAKVKEGKYDYIEDEMRAIKEVCDKAPREIILKVILETCYLTDDEIVNVCKVALKVKPDFVKTSTGMGTPAAGIPSGATVEHVRLMKSVVGDQVGVKASGGIRDWPTFKAMVEAGATRIGTSSGVKIIEQFRAEQK